MWLSGHRESGTVTWDFCALSIQNIFKSIAHKTYTLCALFCCCCYIIGVHWFCVRSINYLSWSPRWYWGRCTVVPMPANTAWRIWIYVVSETTVYILRYRTLRWWSLGAITNNIIAMLTIRIIYHARDLWKLARSYKQLHFLCPPNPCNLPGTVLLSWFQSSHGALKSTE